MTERTGGSDVGGTETIAVKQADGTYKLTGFKFFTSATTSQATFLLARIADPVTGKTIPVRSIFPTTQLAANESFTSKLFPKSYAALTVTVVLFFVFY